MSFAITGSLLSLGLAGCGSENAQEMLGYEQKGPDEMAVIKRPPLILPPDYNLRPPSPDNPRNGSGAASDTARETLIGPSSGTDDGSSDNLALLTGGASEKSDASENGAPKAVSEGQNLLISRTDRAERDLDTLTGTRSENRVDGPLLRRLLAWTPEDQTADADEKGTAGVEIAADDNPPIEETVTVQVVARSQTAIPPKASAE